MSVINEHGKLRKVLLCQPLYYSWQPINEIAKETLKHHYKIKIEDALKQHLEFSQTFKSYGVEVLQINPGNNLPYQVYTRDLGVQTKKGILIGGFREPVRTGEKPIFEDFCLNNNLGILGKITMGAFEGGDVHYIDSELVVCGLGSRSNQEGIENARKLLSKKLGITLLTVKFDPKFLHLDVIFVKIAQNLSLACIEALPTSFVHVLKDKKIELVNVPKEEAMELKCNVVSVDENTVMSFKENINTNKKLEALGFTVLKPDLSIFTKGGGGPRCLSFPLERDSV